MSSELTMSALWKILLRKCKTSHRLWKNIHNTFILQRVYIQNIVKKSFNSIIRHTIQFLKMGKTVKQKKTYFMKDMQMANLLIIKCSITLVTSGTLKQNPPEIALRTHYSGQNEKEWHIKWWQRRGLTKTFAHFWWESKK